LGIGDATNGETFRVGSAAPKVYVARAFIRQVFALGATKTYQGTDQNQLAGYVPEKYLALTVGKVGIADYFDDNSYSHDARTQFMCWGLMDNGAWDYPANTRGYTPSVILEYVTPKHELRYSVSLLPKVANGPTMDWNVGRSSAHNLEYTHRHTIANHKGAVRLLAFYNTTDMGNYRQSIVNSPVNPDLSSSQKYGNSKYGFTLNAEQEINSHLGAFVRASWNDGNNEIWAFTQIDNSVSGGLSLDGSYWKRPNDHVGLAYVTSGLSKPHQDYLNAGGKDFMLGDGKLNYTREHLIEAYYSFELKKDLLYLSGAYQFLLNPGYNKDRQGPVNVFSIRVHVNI
jgi:high affinity Mn2+ porin